MSAKSFNTFRNNKLKRNAETNAKKKPKSNIYSDSFLVNGVPTNHFANVTLYGEHTKKIVR